jgi:ABC-type multidrug transport system fused ATPase/permease subunit
MIALVGESGSGKSTTLALLRGTLVAHVGDVWCDGQKLPGGLPHIAKHCTLIPQEPEIFKGSVLFNITLGVDASEDAVARAVQLARFDTVLARLPNGLATDISEKGVNLSGGEKQRLAVARGLFFVEESGSEIVLMDEPTSSVDQRNERLIYQGLRTHFSDRCIVSSLHELALLPLFDEVVVFAHGRVVACGSPKELFGSDGSTQLVA